MIAFDGSHTIAIILEAQNESDFKTCDIRMMIAPGELSSYLIFRVLDMGLQRRIGQWYNQNPMQIDGWTRSHVFHSGQPYWRRGSSSMMRHPNGWTRMFDRGTGRHYWYKAGSQNTWETPLDHRNAQGLQQLFQ